ncbi:hypothetical protein [Streptomyces lutosisoli]|uniref:hypothetical protein n=1 Tax=Streptomyces lutosisoli TaxID=2665721 RepID=UPI0036140B71
MSRAVMRHVRHTIRHEPEGGVTYEAFCVSSGCNEECAWVIKARKTGVRPTIERFRFWWVGDEKPEGVDASMTLESTPSIQMANAEER